MNHTIFLSLGSNLGDREANLRAALQGLDPAVRILERSAVYETPPWGYQQQPVFLNQVVKAETDLSPMDLLNTIKVLEAEMGRESTVRFGPRLIDIDILFYDALIIEQPNLTIPHPRLQGRAFVLVPLSDLAPCLRHPVLGKTVCEMLNEADAGEINLFNS